ncbi:MAG: sensor histidine kinase, partial [Dokdonella sp.]
MTSPFNQKLLHLRGLLVPEHLNLEWAPFYSLGYLIFLFLPAIFGGQESPWAQGVPYGRLGVTLLSVVFFLPLYFLCFRLSGLRMLLCIVCIASLCYLLLPYNGFSNTYLIYAMGAIAYLRGSLWLRMALASLLLAAFLVEVVLLGFPLFIFGITVIIGVAVFFAQYFQLENQRKVTALKLSHDEVRRLAALAERERIGRDLHDLLGHTLSLIALKSELAGKLFDRDASAARREIDDVTRVARDALSQVRHAVTGIRAAGLGTELAAARQLLESAGVSFSYALADVELSTEQETALSLVVREAVTNIQRHARATKARVELVALREQLQLRVEDDGNGGDLRAGNG